MPHDLIEINPKSQYMLGTIENRWGISRTLLYEWIANGTPQVLGYGGRTMIFGKDLINAIKRNRPDWWTKAMRGK